MQRISLTESELINRARELANSGRKVLGITGAPGAGKSTVTNLILKDLGEELAAFAPMDGFHLSNETLEREGKLDRKGAIDTFDAFGYLNLLRRIKSQEEPVVHAPDYYRKYEESIGSALAIKREVPLVVTEGNYLLFSQEPWGSVRDYLDECWFIELEESLRIERLIKRHIAAGKSPEAAKAWSLGPDQRNAETILALRDKADLVITLRE